MAENTTIATSGAPTPVISSSDEGPDLSRGPGSDESAVLTQGPSAAASERGPDADGLSPADSQTEGDAPRPVQHDAGAGILHADSRENRRRDGDNLVED